MFHYLNNFVFNCFSYLICFVSIIVSCITCDILIFGLVCMLFTYSGLFLFFCPLGPNPFVQNPIVQMTKPIWSKLEFPSQKAHLKHKQLFAHACRHSSPLAWKIKTAPYHLSLLTRLWTACPLAWLVTRQSKQPHVWLLWPCKLPSPLMEPSYFPKFQLAKNRWRDLTAHLFSLTQRQKEKHKKENDGELTKKTQKRNWAEALGRGLFFFLNSYKEKTPWGCESLTLVALTIENNRVFSLPPPM